MNFSSIDLLVLILYILVIVYIGFSAGKENKNVKDFYLGGNRLPWFYIMLSIIATETSSLTFLSIPGIAYKGNLVFLQLAFGYILGRALVAFTILPLYRKGEYISVYEWIGSTFGTKTQKSASSIFLITRVLADGVRLFVTSIPVALIFQAYLGNFLTESQIGIATLVIISIVTIVYTVFGGFKSVVMTDAIQFFIYIFGGVFCFIFLFNQILDNRNITSILPKLIENHKLDFIGGIDKTYFTSPYFFVTAVLGGMFISFGSHGVDQMIAQRLIACKSDRESRFALIGSGIIVFFQFILFLSIGLLLYIYYGETSLTKDAVFSKYITENIPSPILGLIIAAILASAMSTLSSTINSLSLSLSIDWNKKFVYDNDLLNSRITSVFWGVVLFFSSLIPYYLSGIWKESLLEIGLTISSFTLGPMIGLFLLGLIHKHKKFYLSPNVLIVSIFSSLISVILISYFQHPAFTFLIPLGISLFMIFILITNTIQKYITKV